MRRANVQEAEQDIALAHGGDQRALGQYTAGIRIDLNGRHFAQAIERAFRHRLGDEDA